MSRPSASYSLKLPSQTDNLELIRNFVSAVARKVGFTDDDVSKIEISVDEACTNVIEHAHHRDARQDLDVAIKIDYEKFTVVVTDRGKGFRFRDVKVPDMNTYIAELRVGGLGIFLMKTLMDKVEYHSKPGRTNEVRMIKYLLKHEDNRKEKRVGKARTKTRSARQKTA
jgi:serine/threonine-protein kinase RsbW